MQHLREICVTLFFSDRGPAIGFAWIGKRTLWSHGCKWNWSFLKPKWAPQDNCPCLVHHNLRELLCLIRSQRNRVIFCHRNHWHNPPFMESLCAVCVVAEWTDRNTYSILQFLVDGTQWKYIQRGSHASITVHICNHTQYLDSTVFLVGYRNSKITLQHQANSCQQQTFFVNAQT